MSARDISRWRISVDGPAASGKTTVARRVAHKLGFVVIDTGAMYRAVALTAIERGVAMDDIVALTDIAVTEAGTYSFRPDSVGEQGYRLLIRGRDVTDRLHTERVSAAAPFVAAVSGVRAVLAAEQRRIGLDGGVVMTGRDIGTVVLPEAEIKVFMTASAEERARRRVAQLDNNIGNRGTAYLDILGSIRERDRLDTERADSPLTPAPDAVHIDTTRMTLDEVVRHVLDLFEKRAAHAHP